MSQEIAGAILKSGTVALDIETYGSAKGDGLDPWKGDIRLVSLAVPNLKPWVLDIQSGALTPEILNTLSRATIIAHNARFDLLWLSVKFGLVAPRVFCTLTASRLLTAGTLAANGLDDVLERHLGIAPAADHSLSDWGGLFLTEDQLRYAARDVLHLHALKRALEKDIRAGGLESVCRLEMDLLPVVVATEKAGMPVDEALLVEFRNQAVNEARTAAGVVTELLRSPALNPSSPKQLQSSLARAEIVVKDTNESTLLAADDGRIIPAILDFRSKEKSAQQAQTLLDAIANDGRIHSHFDPTGTDTGRFASRSPNLQNIARGRLRSCFVARSGRSLITADYSQIELRAAAAIAGEMEMIEAYKAKLDLHRKTAAAIVGTAEISAEDRQIAKSANFGLLYGQGTQGLVSYARTAYGVTLTVDQALAIRNRFFSTYPELARWHADCWKAASEKASEARTRLGRRRLIAPGADRWRRFTALVNSPVQGGCADGIKLAMLALSKALPENAQIVSTVHDELVIECDTGQAADLAQIVSDTMIAAMSGLFPEVPIEVETSIGNAWSKS